MGFYKIGCEEEVKVDIGQRGIVTASPTRIIRTRDILFFAIGICLTLLSRGRIRL